MTLYQKILSVFGLLRTSIDLRVAREELAPLFDANSTYAPGRLVVYDNELYRCTTQHTGAWKWSHFEKTTIDAALGEQPDLKNYVKKDDVVPVEIPDGVKIATIGGKEIKTDLTNCVKKDDVVPEVIPDGVEIATIGGKKIKAPSGGGAEYGYPMVNVTPTMSASGEKEAYVSDYTISTITLRDSTPIKIFLPSNTTGRSLNLVVRVVIDTSGELPYVIFVPPTEDIGFESEVTTWQDVSRGINLFTFTGMTNE